MASGGVFLATEQGDPASLDLALQPMYTIEERPGSFDPRVVYPALRVVELLSLGSPAQLQAKEQVPDPVARQGRFDVSGVEVWRVPGVRARTGVDQNLDPVPLQQAYELLGRMVGMSDGEDRPPPGGLTTAGRRAPALRRPLMITYG